MFVRLCFVFVCLCRRTSAALKASWACLPSLQQRETQTMTTAMTTTVSPPKKNKLGKEREREREYLRMNDLFLLLVWVNKSLQIVAPNRRMRASEEGVGRETKTETKQTNKVTNGRN